MNVFLFFQRMILLELRKKPNILPYQLAWSRLTVYDENAPRRRFVTGALRLRRRSARVALVEIRESLLQSQPKPLSVKFLYCGFITYRVIIITKM